MESQSLWVCYCTAELRGKSHAYHGKGGVFTIWNRNHCGSVTAQRSCGGSLMLTMAKEEFLLYGIAITVGLLLHSGAAGEISRLPFTCSLALVYRLR